MGKSSVIRGTILVFNSWASVLIDIGATHSFISLSFASALELRVKRLELLLHVDTSMGGMVPLDRVCRNCEFTIDDHQLIIDHIVLDMSIFDIILGMDWLSMYDAFTDYFRRRVTFVTLQEDCI